jgi:diguanylate cyclase (GGDEF)-like protein
MELGVMVWLSESRLAGAVLDALTSSICVLDHRAHIVAVNESWRQFADHNGGDGSVLGTDYIDVCMRATGPGADAAHRFGNAIKDVLLGARDKFEIEYPCHSPCERRWFLARVTKLRRIPDHPNALNVAAVVSHQDVTSRKLLELRLKKLAETDELTGLKNRRKFMEAADQALADLRADGAVTSLLLIDLDHFKVINDQYGHAAGDEALRHAANQFRAATRAGDILARIGGEEFAVLLPRTDEWDAVLVADRIRLQLADSTFMTNGRPVPMTATIGVSAFRRDDARLEIVLGRKPINGRRGFPHGVARDSSSFSGASRWAATT